MASLNKVFLMGNLTRDPELRYGGAGGQGGQGGSAICKFGLAINNRWKDAAGQQHEDVTFVDVTVFGRQAETTNEYLRKGRPAFIEGRLQFSTWDDRETGAKRSKLEVVAERVQFLGTGGGGGPGREGSPDAEGAAFSGPAGGNGGGGGGAAGVGAGGGGGYAPRVPRAAPAPRGAPPSSAPGSAAGPGSGGAAPGGARQGSGDGVDFTDDIPF